jgi:hypothetical protein
MLEIRAFKECIHTDGVEKVRYIWQKIHGVMTAWSKEYIHQQQRYIIRLSTEETTNCFGMHLTGWDYVIVAIV